MNYKKIEDIPLNQDITLFIQHLFPNIGEYTKSKNTFGGNNMISILEDDNNNKIVFRRTKKPYVSIPFNLLIPENFNKYLKQNKLPENNNEVEALLNKTHLLQESNIWNLANQHNISPKLYYYGIYRTTELKPVNSTSSIMSNELPKEPYHNIYKIVVSEGYEMNMENYYNGKMNDGYTDKQSNELGEIDKMIANQLINLLDKLHSKIKVICFDIKPSNCVINIDPFDVKLIDLDADWCQSNPILKKRGADEQQHLIKYLSIMILANHFLYYCEWNIFSEYLQEKKEELDTLKKSLNILFCELTKNYKEMSAHYLYYAELYRTDSFGHPRPKPNTCEELFDEMFEDMFILKHKPNNTINTDISSKKRTIGSVDSKSSKRKKGGTNKKKEVKKRGGPTKKRK